MNRTKCGLVVLIASTFILATRLAGGGGYTRLTDQQLAAISGLDDFSKTEPIDDSCARAQLGKGEVTDKGCTNAGNGTTCISCDTPSKASGRAPNTVSTTGITEDGDLDCNFLSQKFVGECIDGVCSVMEWTGPCTGKAKKYSSSQIGLLSGREM